MHRFGQRRYGALGKGEYAVMYVSAGAVGGDGAADDIGGSRCRPCSRHSCLSRVHLVRLVLVIALWMITCVSVAARLRPNSTLAAAYDLKVFFTVIAKDPGDTGTLALLPFRAGRPPVWTWSARPQT
jgi:hypothetical protein